MRISTFPARNLPHVLVLEAHRADPVSMVHYPNVLMTRSAVKKFEEMYHERAHI